jgi:hypothetical protein
MAMAKDQEPKQEQSPFAKQPMAPAYWAMDYYFDNLKRIVSSAPSGGTEFGEKIKSYAEKNLSATHEFIRQLSQAKNFQDLVRLQNEFMQSQFEAIAGQTKSLGQAFTKGATEAVKTPFKNSL